MSATASIATFTWDDFSFLIHCFKSGFSIFCRYIWVKNRLYTFEIHLIAVIICMQQLINKIDIRTQSTNFLETCNDHCFSLTYFPNKMKTHNGLARRLFTLKRFQHCQFQNTFQLACFRSLFSFADHVCCLQVCVSVTTLALIEELRSIWRKICSTQWFHQPGL